MSFALIDPAKVEGIQKLEEKGWKRVDKPGFKDMFQDPATGDVLYWKKAVESISRPASKMDHRLAVWNKKQTDNILKEAAKDDPPADEQVIED